MLRVTDMLKDLTFRVFFFSKRVIWKKGGAFSVIFIFQYHKRSRRKGGFIDCKLGEIDLSHANINYKRGIKFEKFK